MIDFARNPHKLFCQMIGIVVREIRDHEAARWPTPKVTVVYVIVDVGFRPIFIDPYIAEVFLNLLGLPVQYPARLLGYDANSGPSYLGNRLTVSHAHRVCPNAFHVLWRRQPVAGA